MNPVERKLIDFIATRLESMLRRPAVWGANVEVEAQVLQLLEVRRLLLDPASDVKDTWQLMKPYSRFIAEVIPEATPQSLAAQLESRGREAEFTTILKRFVDRELMQWVAVDREPAADTAVEGPMTEKAKEAESTRRLIELLRAEAAAEARHATRAKPQAIDFPRVRQS